MAALPTKKQSLAETRAVLVRLTDNVLAAPGLGPAGTKGAPVRRAVGDLLAKMEFWIQEGGYPEGINKCFTSLVDAGGDTFWMGRIIDGLFEEEVESDLATATVHLCIVFAMAAEGKLIAATTFTNRDEVEQLAVKVKEVFDYAKEVAADQMDSGAYQVLLELAAAVTHHMVVTAQPLPRIVEFSLSMSLPTLALSQRIYGDGTRSEELAAENGIIHPAFSMTDIRALSV